MARSAGTQATIRVRQRTPGLVLISSMCPSTARSDSTRRLAMSRLASPRATSEATSRWARVSRPSSSPPAVQRRDARRRRSACWRIRVVGLNETRGVRGLAGRFLTPPEAEDRAADPIQVGERHPGRKRDRRTRFSWPHRRRDRPAAVRITAHLQAHLTRFSGSSTVIGHARLKPDGHRPDPAAPPR